MSDINTNRRLFDLVRQMRVELHAADLIDEDEYAWLCGHEFPEDKNNQGSPSPRRLEDYDVLRKKSEALAASHAELVTALEEIERTNPALCMNGNAKMSDPDHIKAGWNVHMLARSALLRAREVKT